jgi:putative DNA primase/helicase
MLPKRRTVDEAKGRWRDILLSLGVEAKYLQKGHTSCPICNGGKDRYRFTDLNSKGGWICNQCGHGDGMDLLQKMFGWDWKRATSEIDRVIGTARLHPVRDEKTEEQVRESIRKTLREATLVSEGDPVWKYLNARTGVAKMPRSIRFHPSLWHAEAEKRFPAMLAVMQYPDGQGASVHRTYLTQDGHKAPVEKVKKLMQGLPLNTSCVRLSGIEPVIGIAEGIETALAASVMFGFPVWAATSAQVMEKWEPPQGIREVVVCADNDLSYTGQAAAFSLAKRLMLKGIEASVRIPPQPGMDWADLRTADHAVIPV